MSTDTCIVEGQFDDADAESNTRSSLTKLTETEIKDEDWDDYDDDDDDDSDLYDWYGETGDFTKKYNAAVLNSQQPNASRNKQVKTNATKNFQPVEKTMKKYVDKINVEKYSGPQLSNKAMSALVEKGRKMDNDRYRGKDKADRATAEQVMDKRTRLILFKFLSKGIISEINGCISTGKEANVYHATGADQDMAVKVYKTSILVFKDRDKYVSGEFRFRHGYCKHNPRKMVQTWAEKEMRNLIRTNPTKEPCFGYEIYRYRWLLVVWTKSSKHFFAIVEGQFRKFKSSEGEIIYKYFMTGKKLDIGIVIRDYLKKELRLFSILRNDKTAVFTSAVNLFREHGCLSRLSNLLYQQKMSRSANPKLVTSVANAITNLSSNEENHKKLEDCVSTLVDLTLEDETGESVCLSSLKALTNLSITSQHHGHYTRVVQRLYDLVDTGAASIKLQAAKVLVNLSCNPELVPHMLAAKAPVCLIELLKQGTEEELMLRWTTLLANILTKAKEQKLTSASLPADDKAPSPETMYTALYGVSSGQLKSKVYLLSRHKNENISHQASKIYQVITK
ncbi:RIO kinase 1 [Mytilus galloprovincialis]|uniref:Serine/threonine-protein kinase RIO1 n=1 Tax=Mytilus galloprovincialis TaxID=29158 RepID=A0A8B6EVH0_MYTGA|nr:RIO kinase 1 [Mytilus galloprovincialis]